MKKLKYNLELIIAVTGIIAVSLFIFNKCSDKQTVDIIDNAKYFDKLKSDSLLIVELTNKRHQDSINVLHSKIKEDSLRVISDKYHSLYNNSSKKVRELLKLGICDTVLIEVVMNDCDSTIKSKDKLLAQKDSTNTKLGIELNTTKEELNVSKGMVVAAKTIIANQETNYKTLEESSKKEMKKQKRKTIGAIIIASVTEVLTIFALK